MICSKCGAQLEDGALFCGCCGTKCEDFSAQTQDQVSCSQQSSSQSAFNFDAQNFGAQTQDQGSCSQQSFSQSEFNILAEDLSENESEFHAQDSDEAPVAGNQQGSAAAADEMLYDYDPPVEEVPAPKRKRSVWKIVLIAVAAVVVIAAIVIGLIFSGVFDTDQIKVLKALRNTIEAYSGISDEVGIPDLSKLSENQQINESFSLQLEEYDDIPEIEGIGLQFATAQNFPDQKMDITLSAYYGSYDLVDAQIKLDGSEVYLGIPQFTDDKFYMIDTNTLGEDLCDMGDMDDEIESVSFNVFDLIESAKEYGASDEILSDALEDFAWDTEVKKIGSESIDVNGYDVECTAYEVVIPQEAVADLAESVEEYIESSDPTELIVTVLEEAGLPEDLIDEMEDSMEFNVDMDELNDAIDDMDDIELTVYVQDEYVVSVVYEGSYEKKDFIVTIDCGGGDNYVDDFSIELEVEDTGTARLISTGDHTAESGEFTDETKLVVEMEDRTVESFTSILSYEPESDDDNLSWEINVGDYGVKMEGQLTTGKNSMDLSLDEIEVYQNGKSCGITLCMEYSVGDYESIIEMEETIDLFELSESEMEDEFEDIVDNASDWYDRIRYVISGI